VNLHSNDAPIEFGGPLLLAFGARTSNRVPDIPTLCHGVIAFQKRLWTMARLTPQYKPRDWLQISPVLFGGHERGGHVASYTLFHWWAELTLTQLRQRTLSSVRERHAHSSTHCYIRNI